MLFCEELGLVLLIEEPGSTLAAELAHADQLLDDAGGSVAFLSGVGEEALADRRGDVEPDEVKEVEGAHRVSCAQLHRGVDVGWRHPRSLQQTNGVEEVGEEE